MTGARIDFRLGSKLLFETRFCILRLVLDKLIIKVFFVLSTKDTNVKIMALPPSEVKRHTGVAR